MKYKFIAVEGPIGVGKSSLVSLLASHFKARTIQEDVNNPFLRDFYQDKPGSAFQCQLFFLLSRYRQQMELQQADLFEQATLCDYLFAKDKIFAYLNLSDEELMIYERLYPVLEEKVPKPDLVIYLQASTDVLLERIRRRSRDLEREIAEGYLTEVNRAYNYFFFHYDATPLLVINTSEIDFVHRGADLEELIRQIEGMERGTRYFVPLGSGD
jgi:deoxyadenosine/deoxycytidine kinase